MRKKLIIYIFVILMVVGQISFSDRPDTATAQQSSEVIPDPIDLNGNYQVAERTAEYQDKYYNLFSEQMGSEVNNPFFGNPSKLYNVIERVFYPLQAEKFYSASIFYFPISEFTVDKQFFGIYFKLLPEVTATPYLFRAQVSYLSETDTHVNCRFELYAWHNIDGTSYINQEIAFLKYDKYLLVEINMEASTYYMQQNRFATSISVIQTTEANDILSSWYWGQEIALGGVRYYFERVQSLSNTYYNDEYNIRLKYNELYYSSDFTNAHMHKTSEFYFENRLMSRIKFEPEQGFHEIDSLPYWGYLTTELGSYHELINHSAQYNYSVIVNETYTENNTRLVELSFNYSKTEVIWITGKYYYNPETIKPTDWGDWGINNWLRNLIIMLLNALILALNFLFYLILVALNFLLWVPLCYIVLAVNNYVLFYLTWGLSWVIFASIFVFLWLWDEVIYPILQLLWFYVLVPAWEWLVDNVFIPIWEWLKDSFNKLKTWLQNDGLKYLINLFLIITAFVLAVILWVLSFGRLDFMSLWSSLSEILITINTFIYDSLNMFLLNILLFLGYSITYLIMVGLIYVKYIYCKAKGYVVRAQRLQSMINVYKLPLVLTVRVFQYVIGFLQGGSPTDGADK